MCSCRLEVITGATLHRVREFLVSVCRVLIRREAYKGNTARICQTGSDKAKHRHHPWNGEGELVVEVISL